MITKVIMSCCGILAAVGGIGATVSQLGGGFERDPPPDAFVITVEMQDCDPDVVSVYIQNGWDTLLSQNPAHEWELAYRKNGEVFPQLVVREVGCNDDEIVLPNNLRSGSKVVLRKEGHWMVGYIIR